MLGGILIQRVRDAPTNSSMAARSGRGAPAGGIIPARSLRTTFSQVSGLADTCAGSICSRDSAAGFQPVVMAALAIFLNELLSERPASARSRKACTQQKGPRARDQT